MTGPVRRAHYGIAEIADALGLARSLVTVWRRRRSYGMPEPDDELASGPLWTGSTIEPWIDGVRVRLAAGAGEAAPVSPALVDRAARRLLRLAALSLEDPVRPGLVQRAGAELADLREPVLASAPGELRDTLLSVLDAAGGSRERVLSAVPAVLTALGALADT